jgi:hypothetical protein
MANETGNEMFYPGDPDWKEDQHLVDDFETEVSGVAVGTLGSLATAAGRGQKPRDEYERRGTADFDTEVSGVAVGALGSLRTAAGRGRGTEVPTQRRGMVPKRVLKRNHTGTMPDAVIRGMETDREMTVVTMALGMKAEKDSNREGLKLNVEELVVEDGLQAMGSVKVVRLEVDSTSQMESEDSKRSDRLKSEA